MPLGRKQVAHGLEKGGPASSLRPRPTHGCQVTSHPRVLQACGMYWTRTWPFPRHLQGNEPTFSPFPLERDEDKLKKSIQ